MFCAFVSDVFQFTSDTFAFNFDLAELFHYYLCSIPSAFQSAYPYTSRNHSASASGIPTFLILSHSISLLTFALRLSFRFLWWLGFDSKADLLPDSGLTRDGQIFLLVGGVERGHALGCAFRQHRVPVRSGSISILLQHPPASLRFHCTLV